MVESKIPLRADGVPFHYRLSVTLKETDPPKCKRCCGTGNIGTGWLDDDITKCPVCYGHKTVSSLRHALADPELENHLRECMDKYLREKYEPTHIRNRT